MGLKAKKENALKKTECSGIRNSPHEAKGFPLDQLIRLLYANASCVQTGNDISAICV